jgi:hypothetical protein
MDPDSAGGRIAGQRVDQIEQRARRRDEDLRLQRCNLRRPGPHRICDIKIVQPQPAGLRHVGVEPAVVLEQQRDIEPAGAEERRPRQDLAENRADPLRALPGSGDEDAGIAGRAGAESEAVAGLRRDAGVELIRRPVPRLLEREAEGVALEELGVEVARREHRQAGERVVERHRAAEPGQGAHPGELVALDLAPRPAPAAPRLPVGRAGWPP